MGRPSEYSDEIALDICERLADGESLRSIGCDENMPSQRTIYRWLAANETFCQQYARARETQADTLVDEMLDIADDGSNDWMERRREDGSVDEVVNHEHIARSKLRLDARKWIAAKLQPRKYGDKLDVTSGGDKLESLAVAIEAGNKRVTGGDET